MSLIADLLSKAKQPGRARKDVPPGLTNSINAYKRKETGRRRAVLFAVVALVALVSGFAAVYGVKLASTRPPAITRGAPETVAAPGSVAAAREGAVAPEALATPAGAAPRNISAEKEADGQEPSEIKKEAAVEGRKGADPAVAAALDAPGRETKQEAPDAAAHYYSALDHERRGDLLKAAGSYGEALKLEPRNHRLMNKIASLFMEMRMWEEAEGYLARSLAASPDYVPALINAGIVLASLGRLQEAEARFSRALAIEPLNRLALFNAALLYERQGMPKEARELYLKLRQLGDPEGGKGVERIEGKTR